MGTYEWYFVILQMQVEWRGHSEVVATLKPYLLSSKLFELLALTGGEDAKICSYMLGVLYVAVSAHLFLFVPTYAQGYKYW